MKESVRTLPDMYALFHGLSLDKFCGSRQIMSIRGLAVFNSLSPGGFGSNFISVISEHMLHITSP